MCKTISATLAVLLVGLLAAPAMPSQEKPAAQATAGVAPAGKPATPDDALQLLGQLIELCGRVVGVVERHQADIEQLVGVIGRQQTIITRQQALIEAQENRLAELEAWRKAVEGGGKGGPQGAP